MGQFSAFFQPQKLRAPYRISPMVAAVATSLAILSSGTAFAADNAKTNEELQAEVARLNQIIESLKQPSAKQAAPEVQATETNTANNTTETNVADAADTKSLDSVVVRSRRTAPLESLKETPKSVSVVSGEELQRFETNSFQSILKKLGNVRWAGASTQNHPLHTSLTIRGLGYFKGGASQLDPGVGVNVDGVSYAYTTLAAGLSFYDLDTVDVARGPQGTRGGLSANLGTISFTSKAPTFNNEAEGSVTYGQNDTLITKAVVGGGIIDNVLAWRGTFFREKSDGPFDNLYNKTQSFGNRDRTNAKVQFLFTPTDNFRARVSLDYTPKGGELDGGTAFGVSPHATPAFYDTLGANGKPIAVDYTTTTEGKLSRSWFQQQGNYNYLSNRDSSKANISGTYPIQNRQRGATADLSWDVAGGTLRSITAWRDLFFYWNGKGTDDRTVFDINALPTAADQTFKQVSQEIKFSSKVADVDYQVGTIYLKKSIDSASMNRFGSDAGAFYANNSQYNTLVAQAAGQNVASGKLLLSNSVNRLLLRTPNYTEGQTLSIFGDTKWEVSPAFSINSGIRLSREIRRQNAARVISDNGYGAELNPVSVNNVQLNGFRNDANGNLLTNNAAQLAVANVVAKKYFGANDYASLTADQRKQVAAAKAIRLARLGALSTDTSAESYDDTLIVANISPSYKINDNHTTYFSLQHGEKAGVSQIVGATKAGGVSVPVDTEKTNSYELGLKSLYFGGAISTSTTLFWQDIKNYIQPVYFYDDAQTKANNDGLLAYTEGLGNVPKVRSKGLELDVAYNGRFTTLRFAGAYTDARYIEFKNLAKPPELGGTKVPYYDVSGERLPGSSKFTFNLSANHIRPVFGDKEFHASANYNYTSSYLTEPTLSRYSKVDGFGLTDLVVGVGTKDKKFDASIIVRNLFNVDYGSLFNWNSYAPSEGRWVGINISSKFY